MGTDLSDIIYLNESVYCKLAPSKYGVGVVAIKDISKGTRLSDWFRNHLMIPPIFEMNEEEFMCLDKPIRDLILDKTIYSKNNLILKFISPNHECYLQDFTNHSDTPNVDKNYIALRDIKEGEEIFENFREFTNDIHHLSKEHYTFL